MINEKVPMKDMINVKLEKGEIIGYMYLEDFNAEYGQVYVSPNGVKPPEIIKVRITRLN